MNVKLGKIYLEFTELNLFKYVAHPLEACSNFQYLSSICTSIGFMIVTVLYDHD